MSREGILESEFRPTLKYLRQYLELWDKFSVIDEDGNGYIEEHELEDILDQIDDTFLNENNLDDVLEELDSDNHDGKIDKHEFTKWIMKQANSK